MAENFSSVPVLDFQDAISPDTKAKFLSQLRHALVDIGFFYLRNPPITEETRREFLEKSLAFFDLPLSMKHEIDMPKSKYFKGYTGPRHEKTAAEKDERESLTVCTMPSTFTLKPAPDNRNYSLVSSELKNPHRKIKFYPGPQVVVWWGQIRYVGIKSTMNAVSHHRVVA